MLNRPDAKQSVVVTARSRSRGHRMSRGQSMVEFALLATFAIFLMLVGVQYALIGQAAVAVSQGSSALARYAAQNIGALGTNNGQVTYSKMPIAAQNMLPKSILTGANDSDLTININSYSGTTTTETNSPGFADQCVISLSYTATSKLALPNPFLGLITFPTSLSASDSQLYEGAGAE
jgi:Flp pilus assembly protein TadG